MNRRVAQLIAAAVLAGLIGTTGTAVAQAAPAQPVVSAHYCSPIARVEGVSAGVLAMDLLKGDSLLEIAGTKYKSAGDLATALLARTKTRLDTAAGRGIMSASREGQVYARLLAKVTALDTMPHPVLSAL